MTYTTRIKVKFPNKIYQTITEYTFVNNTTKNGDFGKFDENGRSKIYTCDKNDYVTFNIIVNGIMVTPAEGITVPVVLNGNWNDAKEFIIPVTKINNKPNINEIKLVKARTNIKNNVFLIMGYQGFNPPKGQEVINDQEGFDVGGLGKLIKLTSRDTQVFVYRSTTTDATIDKIANLMKYYKKINSKIKTVIVGHSQGADNAIYMTKKYRDLTFDVIITLDIADATSVRIGGVDLPIGGVDDSLVKDNVKIAINYYQDSEFFTGDKVTSPINNSTSKIINILSPGSNHRSIDNDLSPYLYEDLKDYFNGGDIIKRSTSRKLRKFDPRESGSLNVSEGE